MMEKKQFEELKTDLKKHFEEVIEKKINGGIDDLAKDFKEHKEDSKKDFEEHKKQMQPIYDLYDSVDKTGMVIKWFSKWFLIIGVIITGIMAFIRFFR